jgi:putative flippase GtrA
MQYPKVLKIDLRAWWELPQQVRFVLAGGYNTLFGYLSFVVLFSMLGHTLHYLLIGLMANVVAVFSAYLVHRFFVFQFQDGWANSFLRFYASQLVSMAFGMCLLYALVQFARAKPVIAQAIVTLASTAVSYVLHRFYTFRHQ